MVFACGAAGVQPPVPTQSCGRVAAMRSCGRGAASESPGCTEWRQKRTIEADADSPCSTKTPEADARSARTTGAHARSSRRMRFWRPSASPCRAGVRCSILSRRGAGRGLLASVGHSVQLLLARSPTATCSSLGHLQSLPALVAHCDLQLARPPSIPSLSGRPLRRRMLQAVTSLTPHTPLTVTVT
jgi:hypothetical protein